MERRAQDMLNHARCARGARTEAPSTPTEEIGRAVKVVSAGDFVSLMESPLVLVIFALPPPFGGGES